MNNKFKPGDLAIITNARHATENIGRACELVAAIQPGQTYREPDGRLCTANPEIGEQGWLVVGADVVGRRLTEFGVVPTPGHALVLERWLMPLRGDFQPEQQKSWEVMA